MHKNEPDMLGLHYVQVVYFYNIFKHIGSYAVDTGSWCISYKLVHIAQQNFLMKWNTVVVCAPDTFFNTRP